MHRDCLGTKSDVVFGMRKLFFAKRILALAGAGWGHLWLVLRNMFSLGFLLATPREFGSRWRIDSFQLFLRGEFVMNCFSTFQNRTILFFDAFSF